MHCVVGDEEQSEAEQAGSSFAQLEAAGVAITGLEVVERRMGLGGRTLLTMQVCEHTSPTLCMHFHVQFSQ